MARRQPPPPPKRPRVTMMHLAAVQPPPPVSPFAMGLPKPPPGVVPKDAPLMATDSAIGAAYGWADAANGYVSEGLTWLGYPYLAELSQRAEYRRGAEIIAREMTREWIRFGTKEGAGDKSERLKALADAFERYDLQNLFRAAIEKDNFFGRSQLYIDVGAVNDANPLVIGPNTIKKGSLRKFKLIEPVWTYPAEYNSDNPLADDFYLPRRWYVMGKTVHASRLLHFVGFPVPDLLKPAYSFGGMSMTQMAKPYVDNWIRTRQSVSDLINSFSVSGIKTNLNATLEGDTTGADIFNRVDLFNRMRNNRGAMVLDKETEEFFNISTPLSTLDHLQAQALEQICVVNGIPLVIFTGVTPSGLNASSDGEIAVFYDAIKAMQERRMRPNLTAAMQIIMLSEFGEIDPDIVFHFNPLKQMSLLELANIRKTDADTAAVYITAGVLDPTEERERLVADEDGVYRTLDVSAVPQGPDDGLEDEDGGEDR